MEPSINVFDKNEINHDMSRYVLSRATTVNKPNSYPEDPRFSYYVIRTRL